LSSPSRLPPPSPTDLYTLSLHDALPILRCRLGIGRTYQIPHPFSGITVFENLLVAACFGGRLREREAYGPCADVLSFTGLEHGEDRKSTRLNSSHDQISYAVFCLKKKNK